MSQINYDAIAKAELKQYFLKHQGNKAAFQAYLDRINQRSLRIIASPNGSDFDEKVQAAIRQKLEASRTEKIASLTPNPADSDRHISSSR